MICYKLNHKKGYTYSFSQSEAINGLEMGLFNSIEFPPICGYILVLRNATDGSVKYIKYYTNRRKAEDNKWQHTKDRSVRGAVLETNVPRKWLERKLATDTLVAWVNQYELQKNGQIQDSRSTFIIDNPLASIFESADYEKDTNQVGNWVA